VGQGIGEKKSTLLGLQGAFCFWLERLMFERLMFADPV